MTAPVPIAEGRWYRIAERLTAAAALVALIYFVGVSLGWLPGNDVRPSSLFLLASSASLVVSISVRRRSISVATGMQALSVIFLVLAIVRSAQRQ